MDRPTAVKKLSKLLGKGFGYRVNANAPTPEEREEAKAALPGAVANRNDWNAQQLARQKTLLEGDAEYQRLTANARAARANVEKLSSTTRHYKITVGVDNGVFFLVKAEGDSWEQVIAKVTK